MFVSHSTTEKDGLPEEMLKALPAHAKFRQEGCRRIGEIEGVEVIVDEDIPLGRPWREFLFGEIGECRAAVILVNKQALEHSPCYAVAAGSAPPTKHLSM